MKEIRLNICYVEQSDIGKRDTEVAEPGWYFYGDVEGGPYDSAIALGAALGAQAGDEISSTLQD